MSMSEFIGAIRAGWQQYAEGGMYIGVFFVSLLFLWLVCYNKFSMSKYKGKRVLFIYSLSITSLVLFPASAFALLKYQTAFFTYSQLFLLIPITPVIAWGMTEFFVWVIEYLPAQKDTPEFIRRKPWVCEVVVVVVLVAVLWIAGSLSFANEVTGVVSGSERIPENVLRVLQTLETDEEINLDEDVIVATDEILEQARAHNGKFKLLYGRNMWQKELNAFTYDTYPEELEEFHEWLNTTVHGLHAVDVDISVDEAFRILEGSRCTVMILTRGQFTEDAFEEALANSSFKMVAETEDYVILKR